MVRSDDDDSGFSFVICHFPLSILRRFMPRAFWSSAVHVMVGMPLNDPTPQAATSTPALRILNCTGSVVGWLVGGYPISKCNNPSLRRTTRRAQTRTEADCQKAGRCRRIALRGTVLCLSASVTATAPVSGQPHSLIARTGFNRRILLHNLVLIETRSINSSGMVPPSSSFLRFFGGLVLFSTLSFPIFWW